MERAAPTASESKAAQTGQAQPPGTGSSAIAAELGVQKIIKNAEITLEVKELSQVISKLE
ncbi:MAG: hypothetical protein ACOY9Y_12400 [Bacillota bacterium]